ncbi:MAG: NAD-dependent deacylase [Candidatus Hydrogenedens sp.]|jgi:NAD-dependent deacetylase|nr:NAD-dependent deacylase [Candidatus Hydrogenedens sp.]
MTAFDDLVKKAAEAIAGKKRGVAVTGAGISVESGIEDFRSPGGLWTRYPPQEYATLDSFFANPDKVWEMWYQLGDTLEAARPNPAHIALAGLEEMGLLEAVITQNIDGLHQAGGSKTVIEYHGNASKIKCTTCQDLRDIDLRVHTEGAPRCSCGGIMKPDVIFFGEMIPPDALQTSDMLVESCEFMIIVGTSAQVYPVAGLPYLAKQIGAVVIECNLEETAFTNIVTDYFLQGPAGTTLPRLLEEVRALSSL